MFRAVEFDANQLSSNRIAYERATPEGAGMQMSTAISRSNTREPSLYRPTTRRTFARLTAFDVACPQCGAVDSVSCLRPWWKRKANFDFWRSRWRCRICLRVFAMGVVLRPVSKAGNRPREARPSDTIPTRPELLGLLQVEARGWNDPVNLACECEAPGWVGDCPLRGG